MSENRQLPPLYDRNAAFVRGAAIPALTSAILLAAAEEASPDFPMFAEPTVPSQIFIIYDALPLEAKEKMKAALLAAAAEWNVRYHGYSTLRNLVLAAGYIRATGIIDMLRRILSDSEIKTASAKARDALETVFGVLGGFAPLPAVRTALENLQSDPRYAKHFSPQITNALCWCDPEHYPQYLERFFETNPKRPEDVVAEMVRLIGVPAVTRHIDSLKGNAADIVNLALNRDLKPILDDEGALGYMNKDGLVHPIAGVDALDTFNSVIKTRVKHLGSWSKFSEQAEARIGE